MKNVRLTLVFLIMLLATLLIGSGFAYALPKGVFTPPSNPMFKHTQPTVDYHQELPKSISKVWYKNSSGRAVDVIPPQTMDITPNTAAIDDSHPCWSFDEQSVVFQSNRVVNSDGSVSPAPGTLYHIYVTDKTGSAVTALTGPAAANTTVQAATSTTSQTEPAYSSGDNSIVYVDRGTTVDLKILNIVNNSITSVLSSNILVNTGQPITFTDLNHPTFASNASTILFAGKPAGDTHFHIYEAVVPGDGSATQITQYTSGIADDMNPSLSQTTNTPLIAFDSNRVDALDTSVTSTRNVWVMTTLAQGGATPNPDQNHAIQVTNYTGSNNIEPAWSTANPDLVNAGHPYINGHPLLVFASTRIDANNDGLATGVSPSGKHSIWFLPLQIAQNSAGVYLVSNPESANNPSFKINTNNDVVNGDRLYDDQFPAWPQFISTYRVAYQTNRSGFDQGSGVSTPSNPATANDVFLSSAVDTDAPSLMRYDDTTGTVVDVEPSRTVAPGQTVTFNVKVADFESQITGVYLEIKNPNSIYQSSDGMEHKVFTYNGTETDGNYQHVVNNVPDEYDSEPIFIGPTNSNGTSSTGDSRFNTYPRSNPNQATPPLYTPGQDDVYAFSGYSHAPAPGWLPLTFVSRDPTTGISTYTAKWQTPTNASDYYIDVIAYNNAVDPVNTGHTSNWKIYDNVWGFTTQPFLANHNILFVNDYAAGQKFYQGRFSGQFLGSTYFTYWGMESWMTDFDTSYEPTTWTDYSQNPPKTYPVGGFAAGSIYWNSLGQHSYYDGETSNGSDLYSTQEYDQWRILSRGPLPNSVLQQYLPNVEQQPPDSIAGETAPRTVENAIKCVIWESPYSGDVFTGPGTITDPQVQQQLHNFLMAGGRLFMNGQDVAWALSLNGAAQSSFLATDLRAQFLRDDGGEILNGAVNPSDTSISFMPWQLGDMHFFPGQYWPTIYATSPPNDSPIHMVVDSGRNVTYYYWGAPGDAYPDAVQPLQNAVADFTYAGGGAGIMHYRDTTTGQRVVFAPCGIEGINEEVYRGVTNISTDTANYNAFYPKNRRAEIMHNIVCWLRSGTVVGIVTDTSNTQPLPGVLVRLFNVNDASTQTAADYTGLTDSTGKFVIDGVSAGVYYATATKAGYAVQKINASGIHGGKVTSISGVLMTKASPATITGTVTQTDGVTPIQGATVTATQNAAGLTTTPPTFTATTDGSGNYNIQNVPAGVTYVVTVTATGYGVSIPPSLPCPNPNDPIASQRDTVVAPQKTYAGFNFELKAAPGIVTGKVLNGSVTPNTPIQGATVTATRGTVTVTATTASDGSYSFNNANTTPNGLDPGTWGLVATAAGFNASTSINVSVITNQTTTAPNILLTPVPPGSISGLITRSVDGAVLAGVTVTVTDSSGNVVSTTTTSATSQTASDGTSYNYIINNVPAGATYTLTASATGYTPNPSSQSVTVNSGKLSSGVNFSMQPLYTFLSGTSLVSAPYDYPSQTIFNLLSVPSSDQVSGRFMFATWNQDQYLFAPNASSNTFRLGKGYFIVYTRALPLSIQGTAAPANQPFSISLTPGWNLIGDPFLLNVDITKTAFKTASGAIVTYAQAIANGDIGSALYSFNGSTVDPAYSLQPWQGYWMLAYNNMTLIIDPTIDVISTKSVAKSIPVRALQGTSGWASALQVHVGSMTDDGNILGVSSEATDGFDRFKMLKPPVFGSRYVNVNINHSDWGAKSGGYGIDIRSSADQTQTWNFTVSTNIANTTATLTLPQIATLPRKVSLKLYDLSNGRVVDLRSNSGYQWETGQSPTPRNFKLVYTPATATFLVISNVTARSAGARGAGIDLNFNLSDSANVQVKILDATGNDVRDLSVGASRSAGTNQIVWDEKNNNGVNLPMGVYMVQIQATSLDGSQTSRVTAPVIINR